MARVRRVWRNSFFAFLSQLIRLSTNFLLFVGIARLYGVEAFGQFTTAHTLSTVFLLLADFGFDTLVAMEIARNRPQAMQIARRYFSQKVVFAGAATLAMLGLSLVQHFSWQTRTLVQIFAVFVFGASLNNFFFAFFKGFEEFQHETRISFWINGCLLGLLILLGIVHVPIQFIALAFVITRLIGIFMASGIAARLAGGNVMRITFERWRETWRTVAVFGGYFLFGNLFFVLDTILLSFWRGDRDVGVYQAAFKIVALSLIVPDIAINTMIPVLARLHADRDEQWAILGRLLNKLLSLIALPICMILFLYPDQIIAILYGGDEFHDAVPVLRLFALTIYVRFAVDVYGLMMTTSRRQTARMYIVIAGTMINLALNAYMIPRYGPWGAALVSLVTNILVGIAYIIGSRQSFLRWTGDPLYVLSFCISLGFAILAWNFREVSVWLIAPLTIVLCGLITYFVGFSREEWRLISARSRPISSAPGAGGG